MQRFTLDCPEARAISGIGAIWLAALLADPGNTAGGASFPQPEV